LSFAQQKQLLFFGGKTVSDCLRVSCLRRCLQREARIGRLQKGRSVGMTNGSRNVEKIPKLLKKIEMVEKNELMKKIEMSKKDRRVEKYRNFKK
jgi:hypothetical protein